MVETGSGIKIMKLFTENMLSFFLCKYILFILRNGPCLKKKKKLRVTWLPLEAVQMPLGSVWAGMSAPQGNL